MEGWSHFIANAWCFNNISILENFSIYVGISLDGSVAEVWMCIEAVKYVFGVFDAQLFDLWFVVQEPNKNKPIKLNCLY